MQNRAHTVALKLKNLFNSPTLFFEALPLLCSTITIHCLNISILKKDVSEIPLVYIANNFPSILVKSWQVCISSCL